MKTLTIDGKRYRVAARSFDGLLALNGPGVLRGCCVLPASVTADSPDLKEQAKAALRGYLERRAAAAAMIQERQREGKA